MTPTTNILLVWGLTSERISAKIGKVRNFAQGDLVKIGEVIEALPSIQFRVKLEDGREVLAYLSGKLRMFKIRILPGDKVTVELSPYDQTRGRITYRNK